MVQVSLLEPGMNENKSSVTISDLSESDSGSHQLRVNVIMFERMDGFTFSLMAAVIVKGMMKSINMYSEDVHHYAYN